MSARKGIVAAFAAVALSTGCTAIPYRIVRVETAQPSAVEVVEVSTEAPELSSQDALAQRLAQLEGRIDAVAQGADAQQQRLTALEEQLAEIQRQIVNLTADLDRIEKLVITRYEQFLEEDRKVLEQLDAALTLWIQSMQGDSPSAPPSPSPEPAQPTEPPLQASEPSGPAEPTASGEGQLIILR